MNGLLRALLVGCLLLPLAAAAQNASRLERIKAARTITIAFAEDAAPFSFREGGQPAGYSVDLCQRVVAGIKAQLKLEELKINWVGASTPERLKLVAAGKADLECGITTHTLRRQEQVDFSLPVFVDGGGVLVPKGSPIVGMPGLDGRKVAVVRGTTTAGHLEAALKKRSAKAQVVPVENRADAMAMLDRGEVDAYAGDRGVLIGQAMTHEDAHAGMDAARRAVLLRALRFRHAARRSRPAPGGQPRARRDLPLAPDRGRVRALARALRPAAAAGAGDVRAEPDPGVSGRLERLALSLRRSLGKDPARGAGIDALLQRMAPLVARFGAGLDLLAALHGTDKFGAHDYTPVYESLMREARRKPVRLLEIGVGGYASALGGASLRMWASYFPQRPHLRHRRDRQDRALRRPHPGVSLLAGGCAAPRRAGARASARSTSSSTTAAT